MAAGTARRSGRSDRSWLRLLDFLLLALRLAAELAAAQDREDPRDLTALLLERRGGCDLVGVLAEPEPEQVVAGPRECLPQLGVGLIAQLLELGGGLAHSADSREISWVLTDSL